MQNKQEPYGNSFIIISIISSIANTVKIPAAWWMY